MTTEQTTISTEDPTLAASDQEGNDAAAAQGSPNTETTASDGKDEPRFLTLPWTVVVEGAGILSVIVLAAFVLLPSSGKAEQALILLICLALTAGMLASVKARPDGRRLAMVRLSRVVAMVGLAVLSVVVAQRAPNGNSHPGSPTERLILTGNVVVLAGYSIDFHSGSPDWALQKGASKQTDLHFDGPSGAITGTDALAEYALVPSEPTRKMCESIQDRYEVGVTAERLQKGTKFCVRTDPKNFAFIEVVYIAPHNASLTLRIVAWS